MVVNFILNITWKRSTEITAYRQVRFERTTNFSICKAYHNEFMSQVRCTLKEKYSKYQNNHMLHVPSCMMKGSVEDVIEIASGSQKGLTINELLMQQRVYGIMERVQDREAEHVLMESGAQLARDEEIIDLVRNQRKNERKEKWCVWF